MKKKIFKKWTGVCLFSILFCYASNVVYGEVKKNRRANFIIFFVDDLGYADVEPFGSSVHKTPHISRLAREGMKFNNFYAASAVCSPSRAALLTGSYPTRVGLATGSRYAVLLPKDTNGLNPKEFTLSKMLNQLGYKTGCFGKWHLGDQVEFMPNNHGFDVFFGLPYSNDLWPKHPTWNKWKIKWPRLPLLENEKVVGFIDNMDQQAKLTKMFTERAVEFIEENKDNDFFAYIPYTTVHHPRHSRKQFYGKQKKFDEDKLITDKKYFEKERIAAAVEELDWSVGQILAVLDKLNLAEKTFIVFTSDNGGAAGSSNAPLRGGKSTAFEGGFRSPTIMRWKGTIPAGSQSDHIATHMDLLPTIASLTKASIRKKHKLDGKNISKLLFGKKSKPIHKAFYYYNRDSLVAVRSADWKLFTNGELYNLKSDVSETTDVSSQNPKVVKRLKKLLAKNRKIFSNPKNLRPVGFNPNPKALGL